MNRRDFMKFDAPGVRDQYLAKYGDPLEDVSPQDLMDLMENLWTSGRGTYATLRESLRRQSLDPWTIRLKLVHAYFKTLALRNPTFDVNDAPTLGDFELFIDFRIEELNKRHQEIEAEEFRNTRDKFGIRMPRA